MKTAFSILKTAFSIFLLAAFFAIQPTASADDKVLSTGSFEGKSKHKTSGTVTIVKTDKGYALQLGEDFKFDGAPAPKLGLGKDGYLSDTQFSKLNKDKGAQTYELPSTIDPTKYNEVWLWCEKFNVPLGLATLK